MSVSLLTPPASAPPRVTAAPTAILQMQDACKSYGRGATRTEILRQVNLELLPGEFLAVVGFSGSGKTTMTKLLAGLEMADRGQVLMEGQAVRGPSPERGLVFQNYSLLPWLTVRGNVALSVDRVFCHWSRAERRQHVERFVEMVGLTHAVRRYPHELSGGMRQRVSLARTLAMKPRVLILDEPLSALDALTRGTMQTEILKIWQAEKQTCLMVTNDVDEALVVADRIAVLTPGPGATIGRTFNVGLARPRDKTALNHDAHFKTLRNDITRYLVDLRRLCRAQEAELGTSRSVHLPDLQPQIPSLPSKAIFNRSALQS